MNQATTARMRVITFGLCVLPLVLTSCNSFPSTEEVDTTFERWGNEDSVEARSELIVELLDRICVTESAAQGQVATYVMKRLHEEYLATEDESILIALDRAPNVLGGFGTDLGVLYMRLLESESCRNRYRDDAEARAILYRRTEQATNKTELDVLLGLAGESI